MSTSYSRRDMLRHPIDLTILTCAILTLVACTKSHADAASSAGANTSTSASNSSDDADDSKEPPLDCSKVFTPADAAGILTKPARVLTYTPRPRSCTIEVPNGGGMHIYPGSDFSSEMAWNDVTENANSLNFTALPNAGDRAMYKAATVYEMFSKQGKSYCSVGVEGLDQTDDFTSDRGLALATKLGALCNKVYAVK